MEILSSIFFFTFLFIAAFMLYLLAVNNKEMKISNRNMMGIEEQILHNQKNIFGEISEVKQIVSRQEANYQIVLKQLGIVSEKVESVTAEIQNLEAETQETIEEIKAIQEQIQSLDKRVLNLESK